MSNNRLSASLHDYIQAIYELTSHGDKGVRIIDISTQIGVTKTSTFVAMKKLEKEKLIFRDAKRLVCLTEEGEYEAVLALDKVEIIRTFFVDILGISPEIADADAKALEHITSIETLCHICRYNYKFSNKPRCSGNCNLKLHSV